MSFERSEVRTLKSVRNVSLVASPLSSLCTSSLPKRGAQDAIDETVDTAVDDK